MSTRWSYSSLIKLEQLDIRLRQIVNKVRDKRYISIITGHMGEDEQALMVRLGRSQVAWPDAKHNKLPSLAVDVQPYPYDEDALREDLGYIAGLFIAYADIEDVHIRWGGDWDKDGETADNKFDDLFHFELI